MHDPDHLPRLLERLEVVQAQALLLQRADEPLHDAVALGLAHVRRRGADAEPLDLRLERPRTVLRAPVVPEAEPGGTPRREPRAARTRSIEAPATPRAPASRDTTGPSRDSPARAPQELPQLLPVPPFFRGAPPEAPPASSSPPASHGFASAPRPARSSVPHRPPPGTSAASAPAPAAVPGSPGSTRRCPRPEAAAAPPPTSAAHSSASAGPRPPSASPTSSHPLSPDPVTLIPAKRVSRKTGCAIRSSSSPAPPDPPSPTLACALGHQACRNGISTRYYRLSRLWMNSPPAEISPDSSSPGGSPEPAPHPRRLGPRFTLATGASRPARKSSTTAAPGAALSSPASPRRALSSEIPASATSSSTASSTYVADRIMVRRVRSAAQTRQSVRISAT